MPNAEEFASRMGYGRRKPHQVAAVFNTISSSFQDLRYLESCFRAIWK